MWRHWKHVVPSNCNCRKVVPHFLPMTKGFTNIFLGGRSWAIQIWHAVVMLKEMFRVMEMVMFRDMFMQKLQLSFLYVTENSQKHAQKIQLTKQQKVTIEQPHTQKFKSFFKAGQHPLGHFFVFRYQFSNPSVRKNWKSMLQTTWFCRNNMW